MKINLLHFLTPTLLHFALFLFFSDVDGRDNDLHDESEDEGHL